MKNAILVHGGAGAWDLRAGRVAEAVEACRSAAAAGYQILQAGGSALDAVERATNILEDCPVLDAGRGSYLNQAGEVEMDALIMDGRTLDLGAVAAVQQVRYPISLARLVMERTEHTFLSGRGASLFADSIGFARCEPEDLLIEGDWQQLDVVPEVMDTVGAVAVDSAANLAVATSTGGTRGKRVGRIGDSPLVGSGGYADNRTAAVSATGHGEALMKVVISKRVCDFVEQGVDLQTACDRAIAELAERVGGRGGLIAVDRIGRVALAFNTVAMPHAALGSDGAVKAGFDRPFSQNSGGQ